MKKPPNIPAETLLRQGQASDPSASAWVSANAGSGKTHVLAQRVIRLLLGRTDPSKILCLTYTRAAAANMSNRVFGELSKWTALSDEDLSKSIATLEGKAPGAAKLKLARQLFSKALETPGGLKIQTIHAFCESILHQFPLEANIAAHFQLLDQQMETALFAEARRDMISGVRNSGDIALAEAFAIVLERAGESGLDSLLGQIVAQRTRMREFIDRLDTGEDENAANQPANVIQLRSPHATSGQKHVHTGRLLARRYPALFASFDFGPRDTIESIAAAAWPLPGFDPAGFAAFAQAAEDALADKTVKGIVRGLGEAFEESEPVARLRKAAQGLLRKDGEAYAKFGKRMLGQMPESWDIYLRAVEALQKALDRVALYRMLEGTAAMATIADTLIHRYEVLKTSRGYLDFADLITRTVRLLSRDDAVSWVQFKLDRGIDHILLDEAQDTSPEQWRVVTELAREFFAGQGARDVQRTVFAVGDEKQSIYSFQGANPESFANSGTEFSGLVSGAEQQFREVPLHMSFRSTGDVLKAVDLVFGDKQVRRGMPHYDAHSALREGDPGYVELWPSLGKDSDPEEDDWTVPVDHLQSPAVKLAGHITGTIVGWLANGEILEGQRRRLTPGDILVLVRKRDAFMHALSRSLKEAEIPVAGADRLRLAEHIAVQDMLALAKFLLLEDDDLSLAAVLKSPIFGIRDKELFEIAGRRVKGKPLWRELRDRANGDLIFSSVWSDLVRWRNEAAFKPPFEFFSGILQRDGVRARSIARLGQAAGDMLDEFLSYCLAFEQPGLPGLEALIATLELASPEIRREMDQNRGEVRIMTVHASKGLEAPVVFLVDPGSAPVADSHFSRLLPFKGKRDLADVEGFLWNSGADVKNDVMRGITDDLKDLADDEYRRLLYVGMTRAEDRLIVCGYHGRKRHERSWHAWVDRALGEAEGTTVTTPEDGPFKDLPVLRFRSTPFDGKPSVPENDNAQALEATVSLPALGNTPSPEQLPRPLTPSGAATLIEVAEEAPVGLQSPVLDPSATRSMAAARGQVFHKLLQVLPDIDPQERQAAALRYLAHAAGDWNEAERDAAWASVSAILTNPLYAPIFAPGSRAEVSLMGTLKVRGHDRIVSGQIDRLAVTAREVLIIDYKTNRVVPAGPAEVEPAYVVQMALYAELLAPLYPDHTIRAALLYTEAPTLIELPPALLTEGMGWIQGRNWEPAPPFT